MRPTKLSIVTICLLLVCLTLVVLYNDELGWSLNNMPGYIEGKIPGVHDEMKLVSAAIEELNENNNPQQALIYLEQALAIDPSIAQAYYLLGRIHFNPEQAKQAVDNMHQAITIDPTNRDAYLLLASMYWQLKQPDGARRTLQHGVGYFNFYREQYRPILDDSVEQKFNDKAVNVYQYYRNSEAILRQSLQELEAQFDIPVESN